MFDEMYIEIQNENKILKESARMMMKDDNGRYAWEVDSKSGDYLNRGTVAWKKAWEDYVKRSGKIEEIRDKETQQWKDAVKGIKKEDKKKGYWEYLDVNGSGKWEKCNLKNTSIEEHLCTINNNYGLLHRFIKHHEHSWKCDECGEVKSE